MKDAAWFGAGAGVLWLGIAAGIVIAAAIIVTWERIKPQLKEYLSKDDRRASRAYLRGRKDAKEAGDTRLRGIGDTLELIRAKYENPPKGDEDA